MDPPVLFEVVGEHLKPVPIPVQVILTYDPTNPVLDVIQQWCETVADTALDPLNRNKQSEWVFSLNTPDLDALILDVGLTLPAQAGYLDGGEQQTIYCFYNPRAAHFAHELNVIAADIRLRREAIEEHLAETQEQNQLHGAFDAMDMEDGAFSDTTDDGGGMFDATL
jgi:hypothetical protein